MYVSSSVVDSALSSAGEFMFGGCWGGCFEWGAAKERRRELVEMNQDEPLFWFLFSQLDRGGPNEWSVVSFQF